MKIDFGELLGVLADFLTANERAAIADGRDQFKRGVD